MRVVCLVVAAGRGTRAMQGDGIAKQYQHIGAVPVLTRTLRAFCAHPRIARCLVVTHPDDRMAYAAATRGLGAHLLPPVDGGATRQASVRAGLEALDGPGAPDLVLIHDAARPFIRRDLIDRVLAALDDHSGAIPALAVADTLKRNAAGMEVGATVARNGLYRAQTPQGFRFAEILAAHRAAAAAGRDDFTDDSAVAEWHGLRVAIVEGAEINRKLTTVADIRQADREFRDGSWDGQERRSGFARRALRPGPQGGLLICGAALGGATAGGEGRGAGAIAAALLACRRPRSRRPKRRGACARPVAPSPPSRWRCMDPCRAPRERRPRRWPPGSPRRWRSRRRMSTSRWATRSTTRRAAARHSSSRTPP